jgi:drug/metabolite transporter (DMT)-like permease
MHIAARLGPIGALTTGVVGFTLFYALLPIAMMEWADANKAKLVGPAAAVFANILDHLMLQRIINPCQWAGIAILLACCVIAAWKVLLSEEMTCAELAVTSWLAKLLSRLLR